MTFMELIAALLSAGGVWLAAQRSMLNWPVSLLATLLYSFVFFHAHLYADTALQAVFTVTIFYGWVLWARDKRKHASVAPAVIEDDASATSLPTQPLALSRALIEAGLFLLLSLVWIIGLKEWSDDPTPLMDGGLSGASLLAQLWTARRHRVSWLLWSAIDLFYTGLFLNRHLTITALLYGGYTLLGLYGYWRWKR